MDAIRIVLAEDHPLMREGTRRILEQCPDFRLVGEAEDGPQALELIRRLQPDVVILDIHMPKLSGIEVVRQIKQHSSRTKALVLTAYDDDDYILALMQAGASGYILKTVRAEELIVSVQRTHAGEVVLDPAVAAKVARLWAQYGISAEQGGSGQLTIREREVLQLAARGLASKAIAERLSISVRTVEGHFNNIFNKLGVSSRLEAVLRAADRHIISLGEKEQP